MCGISCIVRLDGAPAGQSELKAMMAAMKHRGPDDEGTFTEGAVGLGFVRLSILDLSPAGHQPMFSGDERYVVVFNGEIFNYIELREELKSKGHTFRTQTDTEVLLAAYREWGEEMLHHLNGMWAFILYDRREKTLFCTRDRYGIKPFYYYLDQERLVIGSEIPAILAVLGKKPHPDPAAVFDYLVFNRTDQTDRTFFAEIKKLDHGHCFKWRVDGPNRTHDGRPETKRWYDLRKELKEPFGNAGEFRDMFASSIGMRLRSDVPVGVCLSGGLDSSSITSVLLKDYDKKDLCTFSSVYGAGQYGDESSFIHLYKDALQNMYYIYPDEHTLMADIDPFVRAHAEPVPTTGPYAQFKVMELARQHVTVTLDGQGADEALGGYHYFYGFFFKDLLKSFSLGRLSSEMVQYLVKHRSLMGIKSFLYFLLPESGRMGLRNMNNGFVHPDFYHAFAGQPNAIAGELYGSAGLHDALVNHFEYKLEHLLKWEDRNSMWFSIEARVPFLDYRLVERTLSLGREQIIRNGMTKHILREAMKGTLPEPIRMRRDKTGFGTPQDEWFRTPGFQRYLQELLDSPSFAARGVIEVNKAREIFRKHTQGEGNYGNTLWKFIHLENWYRQFID